MSLPAETVRPKPLRRTRRLVIPPLAVLVDVIFRLVFRTVEWTIDGREHEAEVLGKHGRALYATLHERVPLYLYFFSGNGSAMMAGWKGWAEFGARIMRRHGFVMARGQAARRTRRGLRRDRGGAQALGDIVAHVRAGGSAGLTVDGPHGPRRKVKSGILTLAQETGVPVIPFAAGASRRITLRSWDQMQLPLPMARVLVRFGAPICVPANATPGDLETLRHSLETTLVRMTEDADRTVRAGLPESAAAAEDRARLLDCPLETND